MNKRMKVSDPARNEAVGAYPQPLTAFWLVGVPEFYKELSAFVARRVAEDVRVQLALMECNTIAEFQQVQSAFLQTAMSQYQCEAARLMKVAGLLEHGKPCTSPANELQNVPV